MNILKEDKCRMGRYFDFRFNSKFAWQRWGVFTDRITNFSPLWIGTYRHF